MSEAIQQNRPWAWINAQGRPVMTGLSPEVPHIEGDHTLVTSQPPSMQHTWSHGQWVPPTDPEEQE